jgi:hypothetical protein
MYMYKDVEELGVEFNFQAKETYYFVYTRFNSAAQEINRQKDEAAFQQTRARFSNSLKSELEKLAIAVLQKNQELQEIEYLKRNLTIKINDYLQEFFMKSQSL